MGLVRENTKDIDEKAEFFALLKKHGIVSIDIEFDGCGDNGSVGEIIFDGKLEDKAYHTMKKRAADPANNVAAQTFGEYVEAFAYSILDETGYDWINNDGGFGTIQITTQDRGLHVDMSIRVESYSEHELGLGPEEGDGVTSEAKDATHG